MKSLPIDAGRHNPDAPGDVHVEQRDIETPVRQNTRQTQSDTASSPGTIGRVRGSLPRYDNQPTNARTPTKTASFSTSPVRPYGSTVHRNQAIGCAMHIAQVEP